MKSSLSQKTYLRAAKDKPSLGIKSDIRPEPTLNEARAELSEAISRVATSLSKDIYGPTLRVVSQPAIEEFLRGFEANVSHTKGNFSLIFEELLDRVILKRHRKQK
jgi:hypothetical protein